MEEYSYEQACEKLNEVGGFLTASDFPDMVYLTTHDSIQVYSNALVKRYGPWVLVWTEHNGYQVLHSEDLTYIVAYKTGSIKGFSVDLDHKALGIVRLLSEIPRLALT